MLLALAPLFFCCSVKEYRGGCPAELRVLSEKYAEDDSPGSVRVGVYEGESILGDSLAVKEELMSGTGIGFEVPRMRKLDVTAIKGIRSAVWPFDSFDSLYAASSSVFFKENEELKLLRLPLHKEFSTVTVHTEGESAGNCTYSFVLNSNTDGIDLRNLRPHMGSCRISPRKLREGLYRCRIPRQGDDALSLSVFVSDSTQVNKLLAELSIAGNAEEKPDWNAPDLPDIDVFVDLTKSPLELTAQVCSWELTDSYLEFDY